MVGVSVNPVEGLPSGFPVLESYPFFLTSSYLFSLDLLVVLFLEFFCAGTPSIYFGTY